VTLPHRTPGDSGLRPIVLPIPSLAHLGIFLASNPQEGIAMLTTGPEDETEDQSDTQEQDKDQPETQPHVANPF
jgi:hypothetical protein